MLEVTLAPGESITAEAGAMSDAAIHRGSHPHEKKGLLGSIGLALIGGQSFCE